MVTALLITSNILLAVALCLVVKLISKNIKQQQQIVKMQKDTLFKSDFSYSVNAILLWKMYIELFKHQQTMCKNEDYENAAKVKELLQQINHLIDLFNSTTK